MTEKHTAPEASEPIAKKAKTETKAAASNGAEGAFERVKGITPIKSEYIIAKTVDPRASGTNYDDEAEGGGLEERAGNGGGNAKGGKKQRGQNKARKLVQSRGDAIRLCSQALSEGGCSYGDKCRFEHDIAKYIASKPEDLPGECPVYAAIGQCSAGVKCRWLHSHFADGALTKNEELLAISSKNNYEINRVPAATLNDLQKKKYSFPLSDKQIPYMDAIIKQNSVLNHAGGSIKREEPKEKTEESTESKDAEAIEAPETAKAAETAEPEVSKEEQKNIVLDNAAAYIEPPFKPGEKKKLYLNRAKIVSPLTTVGNLPYRRLMRQLGADYTYCEMALCLPLVQGSKSEWALPRAHCSEAGRFGVQVATATHWQAVKAAEAVGNLTEGVSEINLNSGCPIDLVFRTGAGSALMDNPSRMIRLLNGMHAVSGDIPVTVKIRTGVKDDKPTAHTLVPRLLKETHVAAITIHGRSRAQRYTKLANWEYIGDIAKIVKAERDELADQEGGRYTKPWIIGNGDVYSWEDWYNGVEEQGVDSIMVARGALIKPWIFEEIEARQHLDKSATERLDIIKKYAELGLEHWGSDEYGVNMTRRFLCEFLSFTHRYVPVGIMEHLPPKINDRPPLWKGRNELETLLGSDDYRDWIKISDMFLGPSNDGFQFTPKHKSNAYAKPEEAK